MTAHPVVLVFVIAGGGGTRLWPLTADRCKPALPFGARYRVIDFVLANLENSGLRHVELLVQYRPQALVEHVRRRARLAGGEAEVAVLPPPAGAAEGYRGTADAVRQHLRRARAVRPDLVAVFGADHVYRMDVRQMVDFHVAQSAHATVATLPVPLSQSAGFGIVEVDTQRRAHAFHEKPARASAMPGLPGHALASMGNYIFAADVLERALDQADRRGETDFGHHVLPRLLQGHRVLAYDHAGNHVPGLASGETPGYWRDIGTVSAYFDAHMDTLGPAPRFAMGNPAWPLGPEDGPRQPHDEPAEVWGGEVRHASLGSGVIVECASLDHAVLCTGARVRQGARIERAIVMEHSVVGAGARLKNVIVDRDNAVPAGERIGHDPAQDRRRFAVTDEGIVVVPRGHFPPAARRAGPPAGLLATRRGTEPTRDSPLLRG